MRFNALSVWCVGLAVYFVSIPLAAGADDKTAYSARSAAEYSHKMTSEKVTIAAEAFITDDQAKDAFGKVNPWRYGVLPVLVVIQNDSPNAIRVDRAKFLYILPDRTRVEATPAADVRFLNGPKQPTRLPGTVPPIKLPKGNKNPLGAWEIEGRAFTAKMIPPGQSASGFIYFQPGTASDAASVEVSGILNAVSGQELYYFDIPMSGK